MYCVAGGYWTEIGCVAAGRRGRIEFDGEVGAKGGEECLKWSVGIVAIIFFFAKKIG